MLLLLVTADTQREYEKIRVQARIACGVGGGEQVWASFDQEEEKEEDSQVQVRRCHHGDSPISAEPRWVIAPTVHFSEMY